MTIHNRISRLISMLLCVAMTLTIMPWIPGNSSGSSYAATTATASSEATLIDALDKIEQGGGGTITLTGDIALEKNLSKRFSNVKGTITIDGNGHTIRANEGCETSVILTNFITLTAYSSDENSIALNLKNINFKADDSNLSQGKGCAIGPRILGTGYSSINVTGCTFSNFSTTTPENGVALGIDEQADTTPITIKDCTFTGNNGTTNSPSGGVLYIKNGNAVIDHCTFENNVAHSGAGIYFAYGVGRVVNGTTFRNNTAGQRGGAIHSHGTVFVDASTVFEGNKSDQYGGQIYVSYNDKQTGRVILEGAKLNGSGEDVGQVGGGVFIADGGELYLKDGATITGHTTREKDDKDQLVASNIYVASKDAKIYVLDALTSTESGKLGVSTSNPYNLKELVLSPDATAVANVNAELARHGVTDKDLAAYAMSSDTSTYGKFIYDSVYWLLMEDNNDAVEELGGTKQNGDKMLLVLNKALGIDAGTLVLDMNLPGQYAAVSEHAVGSVVGISNPDKTTFKFSSGTRSVTYEFVGWYTLPEGGEKVTQVQIPAGTTVIYAHWRITEVEQEDPVGGAEIDGALNAIVFRDNYEGGGVTTVYTTTGTFQVTVYVGGEPVTLTFHFPQIWPNDPYRPGYVFKGWSTSATSGVVEYTKDDDLPHESITLYGVWEPIEYTITWDANGGQTTTTNKQNYAEIVEPPAKNPTREGYSFGGWYMDKNGNQEVSSTQTVNGDMTFYAKWIPDKVIVHWVDSRKGTASMSTTELAYNDYLKVIGNLVGTDGYNFVEWNTKEDGSGTTASDDIILNNASGILTHKESSEDGAADLGYWETTFYTIWEENTKSYTGYIVWNDENNNDRVRPDYVNINLYSTNEHAFISEEPVTVTAANKVAAGQLVRVGDEIFDSAEYDIWSYTFTDLSVTGVDQTTNIGYALHMTSHGKIPEGSYSHEIDTATSNNYGTILFEHAVIEKNVTVSVTWDDGNDHDGVRPDAVLISLYRDSRDGGTLIEGSQMVLTGKDNTWYHTYTGLQKYNADGEEIVYQIKVEPVTTGDFDEYNTDNGNHPIYLNDTAAYFAHVDELTNVTARIHWDDAVNRDGERPDTVILQLFNSSGEIVGDKYVKSINGSLENNDDWTYTWEGVKRYKADGSEEVYTVKVVNIDEINNHIRNVLNHVDSTGYSYTVNQMDVYMVHSAAVMDVNSVVNWIDDNDNDGMRPDDIIVQLYGDGEPVEGNDFKVIVDGDETGNQWTYLFQNLPKYAEGQQGEEVVYTIEVLETEEGSLYGEYILTGNTANEKKVRYSAEYDEKQPVAYLTHKADTVTKTLSASWIDDNNNDGVRPTQITAGLTQTVDGVAAPVIIDNIAVTRTLNKSNNYSVSVEGLPKYKDGREIEYGATLVEPAQGVEGYSCSVDATILVFRHTNEEGEISANLIWNDSENTDGIRPVSIVAELYKNGAATGDKRTLTAESGWSAAWTGLASKLGAKDIEYSVKVSVPDGYEDAYQPETTTTDGSDINVTLSHDTETVAKTATLYWNDNSDKDRVRPDYLNIQLYADGQLVTGKQVSVTGDGNEWSYTFKDLPRFANGKEIQYTVAVADNLPTDQYTSLTAGMNLYLNHNQKTGTINVQMSFADDNNADGDRPTKFHLQLMSKAEDADEYSPVDGEDYDIVVTGDSYALNIPNLPVYAGDTHMVYTIVAAALDGGSDYTYTATTDVSLINTTNTKSVYVVYSNTVSTISKTGTIYWYDNRNQYGNRPDSLTLSLYANGVFKKNITVTGDKKAATWDYTVDNLAANENGQPVVYTVKADTAELGDAYPMVKDGTSMNVSLTHKDYYTVNKITRSVDLKWVDNNNAWSTRPENITVTLLANGEEYKTITLSSKYVDGKDSNTWTYTWDGELPTHMDGEPVEYTVRADDLVMYTPEITADSNGWTIREKQSFGIDFTLNWKDVQNDDDKRPNDVTLNILADGKKVNEVTFTGEPDADFWTAQITDLPVWRSNANTAEQIEYTFEYTEEDQEYLKDNFYDSEKIEGIDTFYNFNGVTSGSIDLDTANYIWTSTLVRNKEIKTVTGEVTWDDDTDRDGIRPEEIYVQLFADGVAKGDPVKMTGTNEDEKWTVSWKDQEVYEKLGTEIVYTMQLSKEGVDGYTLSYSDKNDSMNFTMTHDPQKVDVTATIHWNDGSNAAGIERVPVTLQWFLNGEPYGESAELNPADYPADAEDWIVTLPDEFVHYNHGTENEFTFKISSDDLDDLIEDGYTLEYNYDDIRNPNAQISETYFDVSGTAYFRYNDDPSYTQENVTVTAFLEKEDGTYTAVGATKTDKNGTYLIKNVPRGKILVRATWKYNDYMVAGKNDCTVSNANVTDVDILLEYDAANDNDKFKYNASGKAFYQTNKNDDSTKQAISNGTVLLYKVVDETASEYVGVTTTATDGSYSFTDLPDGSYYVVVMFEYEGQTYVYDHSDALNDDLSFKIAYADAVWDDIVKQLNKGAEPVDPDETNPPTPVLPQPCVANGQAYYEDDTGNHTTEPISGVDMYLRDANGKMVDFATTDANGTCSIEGLAVGKYTAIFTLDGYTSRIMTFEITEADFEKGSYDIQPVYFTKHHTSQVRTGTINGTVLDPETGYPYDVMVYVYDEDNNLVTCGYTDANGYYEFAVDPGTYSVEYVKIKTDVVESAEGYPEDSHTTLTSYLISGTTTPDSTVALYLDEKVIAKTTSDADGHYEFTDLSPEEAQYVVRTFSGNNFTQKYITASYKAPKVTENGAGYTVKGTETAGQVELLKNIEGIWKTFEGNTTTAAASGWTISGLEEGEYLVRIDGTDYYYFSAPDSVVDSAYMVTVSGTVTHNDAPVRAARVDLINNITAEPAAETYVTLSDGKYSFLVPEGDYTLISTYPEDGEIVDKKATTQTDSYGNAYPDGMKQGDVWTYNIGAARMSGSVVDSNGNPVSGATVVITSKNTLTEDGSNHVTYTIPTKTDGTWSIGVADDVYSVNAYLRSDETHTYNARETYKDVKTPAADLDFVIDRYTVDAAVVRNGDDKPVEGAEIEIRYSNSDEPIWTGSTNANGQFGTDLLPDEYIIRITKGDVTKEVTVTVDQNKVLHYTLDLGFDVTGTVKDSDGNVINNGIVYYSTASGSTLKSVPTNDDGKFELNLPVGTYKFYAVYGQRRSETRTLEIKTDTDMELVINTAPEGTYSVSGQVLDNQNHPLEHAKVTVTYGDGRIEFATVYTDSTGYFTVTGLPSNTYHLTAAWNGYQTNGEQNVTVANENLKDVVLTVYSAFTVNGVVKDTDGNRAASADVFYAKDGEDSFIKTAASSDGTFGLDLEEGEYIFYAASSTGKGEQVRVTVTQNTPLIELTVPAADYNISAEATGNRYEISGIARDPEGEPVEGAKVELFDEDGNLVDETTSAGDGSWKFEVTKSGEYIVKITIEREEKAPSVLTGYDITGTVLDEDGNPVEGAVAELHSLTTDQVIRTDTTGADGKYEFTNVPEDDYKIIIRYDNGSGEIEKEQYITTTEKELPEVTKNPEDGMITIHGKTDSPANVTLYDTDGNEVAHAKTDASNEYNFVVPAGNYYIVIDGEKYYITGEDSGSAPSANPDGNFILSGTVVDAEGNVVPGATVQIIDENGNVVTTAKTDENGYYAVNVEKGNYTVKVIYTTEHKVDITVQNAVDYTISGTVTDKQGNPAPGATVTITDTDGNTYTTTTDENGRYEYGPLPPGDYTITAQIGDKTVRIEVTAEGNQVIVDPAKPIDPDNPDEPDNPVNPDNPEEITLSGKVSTNHARPLVGAVVKVVNEDTGDTYSITTGENGAWTLENQPAGHYTITADYLNSKGETNHSTESYKNHHYTTDQDNLNLTITLYYMEDVDQDGTKEPVYAGEDDRLETPDDFYDMVLDGDKEPVYVGTDGKPGTPDDYYIYPVDGKDTPVKVGADGKPLTPDDHYSYDLDKDGKDEDVKIGDDCRPDTDDDWYAMITFDANGGVLRDTEDAAAVTIDVMEFINGTSEIPAAVYSGHTFYGWTQEKDRGTVLTADAIKAIKESTTLYAKWTSGSSGGSGGSGGGGGTPSVTSYTVTFDSNGGSSVSKQTVESGGKVSKPKDPTKDGYTFDGWYTNSELLSAYDFDKAVTKSFTLYAKWQEGEDPTSDGNQGDVSDILNTQDHNAYMQGYPDKNFRPTANMTRAEAAQMFYNLLLDQKAETSGVSFKDVTSGSWYEDAVKTLAAMGILTGYTDGFFKPDDTITRAEFATICTRFAKLADVTGKQSYSDVNAGDWFYQYIETAAQYGWIAGYADGTFKPNANITRAEVSTLVNRVLGRNADEDYVDSNLNQLITFPDNPKNAWYYYSVMETTNTHNYAVQDNKEFWAD